MKPQARLLGRLARKYCWWKSEEDALVHPDRIVAQVMNIGAYDDVQTLVEQIGEDALRKVLHHAEAGQFDPRSWAYWHYRLRMAEPEQVPPLPTRKVA